MSNQFVYKPVRDNGGGLVVVLPSIYTGRIQTVQLVDRSGNVVEQGRFRSVANGNRSNWDFRQRGQAYAGMTVRVVDDSGRVVLNVPTGSGNRQTFNVGSDGSSPYTPSGSAANYQGSTSGGEGGGGSEISGSASGSYGGGQYVQGAGGTGVYTPNFIQYDPASLYINYDEAERRADERSDKNVDRFGQNFQLAENFAAQTIETELKGLEKFLPRSTDLIRQADQTGNRDVLQYSDMFDQRNQQATYAASDANVARRGDFVEEYVPGTFKLAQDMVERLKGDINTAREDERRIRERESKDLLSGISLDVASRSARNTAADTSAAGGFGVDSAQTRNMLDRFDFDRRFELESANRVDARQGDQAIALGRQGTQTSEQALMSANTQAQQSFQALIAPGILDFQPIQAAPRVTDIGSQIRPMPTNDAGSIRANFTNQLTPLTTIAPSQAFSSSFEEQKYNRERDYQWLQYQQQQNDIMADALNVSSNLVVSQDQRAEGQALFQQALDQRRDSEFNTSVATLVTAAAPFVMSAVTNWVQGGKQPGAGQQQVNQTVSQMIMEAGKEGYNDLSAWFQQTFGMDIGQFDTTGIGASVTGGASGTSPTGGNGTTGNDIWANPSRPGSNSNAPELSNPSIGAGSLNNPNDFNSGVGGTFGSGSSGGSSFGDKSTTRNKMFYDPKTKDVQYTDDERGISATVKENGNVDFSVGSSSNMTTAERTGLTNINTLTAQWGDAKNDPTKAPSMQQQLQAYGLDPRVVAGMVNLWTNWDNIPDSDRVFQTASVLNNIADNMQLYENAGPIGGVVSSLRQASALYNNWDTMSDGERSQAGVQIAGTLGTAYASYTGALAGAGTSALALTGVGALVSFGIMSVARGTRVAIDEGLSSASAISAVGAPTESTAFALTDNWGITSDINNNDKDNAALAVSGFYNGGAGWVAAASNILGGRTDFTSGKNNDQKYRDSLRDIGADPKYGAFLTYEGNSHKLQLADGTKFDIGKDGNNKLPNIGTNIDGNKDRHYFDIDYSNPIINDVIGIANPLSVLLFRNAGGMKMVSHLTNALTAKDPTNLGNVKSNAKDLALKAGIDYNTGVQLFGAMKEKGQLDQNKYDAFMNGWRQLMLG